RVQTAAQHNLVHDRDMPSEVFVEAPLPPFLNRPAQFFESRRFNGVRLRERLQWGGWLALAHVGLLPGTWPGFTRLPSSSSIRLGHATAQRETHGEQATVPSAAGTSSSRRRIASAYSADSSMPRYCRPSRRAVASVVPE